MALTGKKIRVIKKEKAFNIYFPCRYSDNFIRYEYLYVDNNYINMHQWRVFNLYICNADGSEICLGQTEWEGAILEEGAPDFMGGYHGDENNVSLSVIIDNKMYSAEDDFELECEYIKLSAVSLLNRPEKPDEIVFRRCKISEWDVNKGYIINNRFELLEDIHIRRFENIMMSLPLTIGDKRFVEFASNDTHPSPVFISLIPEENSEKHIFTRDKGAKIYEAFAPNYNFYAKVEGIFDNEKYPNGNRLVDNWRVKSDKTFKVYYNMTGDYQGKKGENFISKSIFTLEA